MPQRERVGFTLIELLIVVAVMAILAAIVVPSATPAVSQRLRSAAEMLATDLGYVRSLAVSNASQYRVTFDLANNQYVIEHSGSNGALDTLPPGPFRAANDPADEHIVDLDLVPTLSRGGVQLSAVTTGGGAPLTQIEFGPLGATTESDETVIWFSAGSGTTEQSVGVFVNPVTGLATVGGSLVID